MSNVINLFDRSQQKSQAKQELVVPELDNSQQETSESQFSANIRRNNDVTERLKKARLEANKSVLKDYKIKK